MNEALVKLQKEGGERKREKDRKKGMNTNEKLVNNIFFVDNTCVNAYRCI